MGPGPFWEATSRSATQEFPIILWNLKLHCRVHERPPLILIWDQMNLVHITPSIPLTSILILCCHLRLGIPSVPLSSGFSLYAFLFCSHACYMPCPSYPPWLYHSNYIKLPPVQFHISSLLGQNILSTLFSNTCSLCSRLYITNK
jgi:hypothetical protein